MTLFGFLMLLIMGGCASIPSQSSQSTYFKSKDYIIYQLRPNDTPALLAERFLGDARKDWLIEEANRGNAFRPDHYVVIPLRPGNKGGIYTNGVQTIPILCYHRFGNHCDSPLCVPEQVFERQMYYLKKNGYRVISPQDLISFLSYSAPLPQKAVMITVDDGYRSFYTVAYPILKKYGFTATMFVYTNYVGVSSKAITWDQLRDLKANGFTIGSHTIAHSDLSKPSDIESDEAYMQRLRHEIFDSKKIIDRELDQNTIFFAYPFGRSNEMSARIVRQAGYKLAVTVKRGGNAFFAHPYLLRRDQVLKRDLNTFKSRLMNFYPINLR
ncbi:MAG: polysaccharide deacetylase family protein [Desulfosarcinaceae bacterium]